MPEQTVTSTDRRAATARLESALAFAREAERVVMRYFGGSGFQVETKRDGSSVTVADREAEETLRGLISEHFPDDGVLGEEFGETPSRSGWRWILDPIDGTASFVHGVPLFGTLIACEHEGRSRAGVIHMPALGETVYASEGGGAWHLPAGRSTPVPARVSDVDSIGAAMMCTTSYAYFRDAGLTGALQTAFDRFGKTRGWSDCYAHVLCATGRIDAVLEPVLHPWDIAPMTIIHAEAGGRTTDWKGRPGAYHPTGISTNGRLHEAALEMLAPHSAGL